MNNVWEMMNEQLKYDSGSKEYTDLGIAIDKAEQVEDEIVKTCEKLTKVWKQHPCNNDRILSISIGADGYYNVFALNAEARPMGRYIIDRSNVGGNK